MKKLIALTTAVLAITALLTVVSATTASAAPKGITMRIVHNGQLQCRAWFKLERYGSTYLALVQDSAGQCSYVLHFFYNFNGVRKLDATRKTPHRQLINCTNTRYVKCLQVRAMAYQPNTSPTRSTAATFSTAGV